MSLLALSILVGAGHAATCHDGTTGTDDDSDGWCLYDTPYDDCDDSDGAINPWEVEDGLNGVDEDCDGSYAVERSFINTMDAAALGGAFPFNVPAGAATPPGLVVINRGGLAMRILEHKYTFPFATGELTAVIKVDGDSTGGACTLHVVNANSDTCFGNLVSGTNIVSCPAITPGYDIQTFNIECPAGWGSITLDWLAVQNGPYVFAPMVDQDIAVEGVRAPSGGAMVTVRTDEYRELMLVGSNVGGFAWSDDGENWTTANGRPQDLDSHDTLGIFEILAYDDDSSIFTNPILVVQTGYQYTGGSAMYLSADMGNSWDPADMGESLGVYKLVDDCSNNEAAGESWQEAKNVSSGRTLLLEREDGGPSPRDIIYVAAGEDRTNGSAAIDGKRGIWIKEMGPGGAVCQPYDPTTLPTQDNSSVGIDAIPSALALANVVEGSNFDWFTHLLVGYRVVAGGTNPADRSALYLCPSVQWEGWHCGDVQLACEPVVDAYGEWLLSAEIDVRDIEPLNLESEANYSTPTFAIADGGRRAKSADPSACHNPGDELGFGYAESTVLILELTPGTGSTVNMDLWQSDSNTSEPAWALDEFGAPAVFKGNNASGCQTAADDHFGDLVAPGAGASASISTLIVDPDEEYLFAMYPSGPGSLTYGCPRVFRTELDLLAEDGSDWLPLQDWVAEEMGGGTQIGATTSGLYDFGPHATDRRSVVDLRDSWLSETGRSDVVAPGWVVNAEFVDPSGEEQYELLVGSMQLWALPRDLGADAGWDSPTGTVDFDLMTWNLAFGGDGSSAFQDVGVNDVATCHGCDSGRDIVYAANQDVKYYRAYGPDGGVLATEAADAPCPFEKTGLGGEAIDAGRFFDPDEEVDLNFVWFAGNPQSSALDSTAIRSLYVSMDGGDTYCWDRPEGADATQVYDLTAFGWGLECSDRDWADDEEFYACDLGSGWGDVTHLDSDGYPGVGTIRAVKVIDARRALLLASTACVEYDSIGLSCLTYGGGGLFLATLDTFSGIAYEHIPTDDVVWTNSYAYGSCSSESDRFTSTSMMKFWVHPDTDWSTGGTARVFISFHRDQSNCDGGLAEVVFDVDDPEDTGTTWWRWDVLSGIGGATNNLWAMSGSPDGDRVLLGGGSIQSTLALPLEQTVSHGWITALVLDDPPLSNTTVTWTRETVISPGTYGPPPTAPFPFIIAEIMPHPHINGQWYFGGYPSNACPSCAASGLYGLQRWWSSGSPGGWAWGWRRVSDNTFENGRLTELAWGNDDGNTLGTEMSEIYIGTMGSGLAQGAFRW